MEKSISTYIMIKFKINNIEYNVSIKEAINLKNQLENELSACRTKCPTCRCMLLPKQICSCCSDVLELDPLI